jgi:hypothetical protein
MSIQIILIYCVCHDLLLHLGIHDDQQCKMTTAEIMTFALSAAIFFEGNFAKTRRFFIDHTYFTKLLSHSKLNRRIHEIDVELWETILQILSCAMDIQECPEYVIDSFPVPVCHPCRSKVAKLYNGKEYLGYCASKKMHYFGLKVHVLISINGIPLEFLFTPASFPDGKSFQRFSLNIPQGSKIYGDKAYNNALFEEQLENDADIILMPQRKVNMIKQHSERMKHIVKYNRKRVETVFSKITKLFPRSISARSSRGFELRVFLFIFGYVFQQLASLF